MRFSASSLAFAIALPSLAAAVDYSFNATIYTGDGCNESGPTVFSEGTAYSECVALNETTFGSIRAYEKEHTGHCNYYVFSDSACDGEHAIDPPIVLDGTCHHVEGFRSFYGLCHR